MGIAVGAEYLVEAVTAITSKTKPSEIQDLDGKRMMVGTPRWSSTLTNLTLLGISSTLPEIFLSFMSVFTSSTGQTMVPSELGPSALIGSAAFNLLITSAVSMAAVSKFRMITETNLFMMMATFSALAFLWLFIVLLVISPGVISVTEAVVTLIFFPLLIMFSWLTDKCTGMEKAFDQVHESDRSIAQQNIARVVEMRGAAYVLEMATGQFESEGDEVDVIQEYFKCALDTDDLSQTTLSELAQVAEPACPVERLIHRRGVVSLTPLSAPLGAMQFGAAREANLSNDCSVSQVVPQSVIDEAAITAIQKGTKKNYMDDSKRNLVIADTPRIEFEETTEIKKNNILGFKQKRWAVMEGADVVTLVIEKRDRKSDQTFWVETVDDTAFAGKDYQALRILVTMKANDSKRNI